MAPRLALSCSTKAWVTLKVPCRFTFITRSQICGVCGSSNGARAEMPALLTSTSMAPWRASHSSAKERTPPLETT